jgi:hypothetical protein
MTNNNLKIVVAGAVACAIIISGGMISVQNNKAKSIERQQKARIDREKAEAVSDRVFEAIRQEDILECMDDAEDRYWRYAELNGTGKRTDAKGVSARPSVWKIAEEQKQAEIDICFRRYPAK